VLDGDLTDRLPVVLTVKPVKLAALLMLTVIEPMATGMKRL